MWYFSRQVKNDKITKQGLHITYRITDQYCLCYAFSKMLGPLMYNRLISLVSIKNILTQAQNGFTEKTSTEKE
jgi:hypothetical protein